MILKRIYSVPEAFDVAFRKGLNIICSDKTKESREDDTRHGTGKTTLIELINFCLAADIDERFANSEDFKKFEFILELEDYEGKTIKVKRSVEKPDIIFFSNGKNEWKSKNLEESRLFFKGLFFDLREDSGALSFRTLTNFLIRDEKTGFMDVFSMYPMWSVYLRNAVNLFLIGLDYRLPLEKNQLEKEKEDINKIIYGFKTDFEYKNIPNKSTLKSEKAILEESIRSRQEKLDNFKVLYEYSDLEKKASHITEKIKNINNLIFVNDQKLIEYNNALSEKITVNYKEIEELYKSLKIFLPESLKKEYEDIENFHTVLIENRNKFIREEINRVEASLKDLNKNLELLDNQRSKIFKTLKTHGALKEYDSILDWLNKDREKLTEILGYLKTYEEISNYSKKVNQLNEIIKDNISRSEDMINKNEDIIKKIILRFNETFKKVFNVPGILVIGIKDEKDKNFEIMIKAEREKSYGVKMMEIFSYDTSIILHNLTLGRRFPRFLIHDGIFKGVDERQKANALRQIINESQKNNFQYICTMNTDEFKGDFEYEKYIVLRLNDKDITGSLMKFKF